MLFLKLICDVLLDPTSWAAPASASRCVFLRYTRKLLYIFLPSTAAEEEEAAPQEAAPHVAIATAEFLPWTFAAAERTVNLNAKFVEVANRNSTKTPKTPKSPDKIGLKIYRRPNAGTVEK
eukprot:scaffold265_cov133-Skeletonema_menzelii.AAC.1